MQERDLLSRDVRDIFCRMAEKMRATSFARPAHIVHVPYETGCKADVNQTSGDIATACLPSRLLLDHICSEFLEEESFLFDSNRDSNAPGHP